jgi:hypothetical protein
MKHKIIHTENYLLVVDGSEIKEGDKSLLKVEDFEPMILTHYEPVKKGYEGKKIIAHLPLNSSPILEGVDLLSPLEQEDNAICPYPESKQNAVDWHNGYNKAKEKYKFTEEDMLRLLYWADSDKRHIQNQRFEDFIQSLSQPKNMPVGFECEVRPYTVGEMSKLPLGTRNEKIKTTTNLQGQTQWVGKYIY